MYIKINSKKKIEGEKPIFDLQGPTPITLKTDQDFSAVSSSLYLAGSRVFADSNKLLFFSTDYSINGKEVTFNVDTYTENYLNYIKEVNTAFNLEFGARQNGKTIFLLDKVFGNPRVYLQGVPPSGDLNEYYTKPEMNDILSTNYWTKFEVAQAIAEIQTMDIEVLSALPPIEEAQEYTIYLVPAPSSEIGNFYDEYLVINQQFELVGSTTIDMSQYATIDSLSAYLPLSGGEISGDLSIKNGIKFRQSGYFWQLNKNYNVFEGSGETTYMSNKNIYFNTINDVNSKVSFLVPSGHIQYNNHNENTPGGFSILDPSGNVTASGYIQNGVEYDLSSMMPLSGYKFVNDNDSFTLTSSNDKHLFGVYDSGRNIIIGRAESTYDSTTRIYSGIFRIYSDYIQLNDHNQNTPGGFVIQNLSGKISAPYLEATSGLIENNVEYHLNGLQEKTEKVYSNEETITLSSNTYIKANTPLSSLTLTIPSGLTNSTIFFKTDDTFSFTIDAPSGTYTNEDFDFGPSGAYLLSVEDEVILWSELIKRN